MAKLPGLTPGNCRRSGLCATKPSTQGGSALRKSSTRSTPSSASAARGIRRGAPRRPRSRRYRGETPCGFHERVGNGPAATLLRREHPSWRGDSAGRCGRGRADGAHEPWKATHKQIGRRSAASKPSTLARTCSLSSWLARRAKTTCCRLRGGVCASFGPPPPTSFPAHSREAPWCPRRKRTAPFAER